MRIRDRRLGIPYYVFLFGILMYNLFLIFVEVSLGWAVAKPCRWRRDGERSAADTSMFLAPLPTTIRKSTSSKPQWTV